MERAPSTYKTVDISNIMVNNTSLADFRKYLNMMMKAERARIMQEANRAQEIKLALSNPDDPYHIH